MPSLTPPPAPDADADAVAIADADALGPRVGRVAAVLKVTALVSAAGAVAGAVTAPVVATLAQLVRMAIEGPPDRSMLTSIVNMIRGGWALGTVAAVYGAVLGPLLGWTLLRRVPIGRAAVTCAIGAAVALVAGLVAMPLWFDGVIALAYPVVGGLVTAMVLRWRQREPAKPADEAAP